VKIDLEEARIFVRPGATDMRKHISGLAAIAESTMKQSPLTGNLFLFSNRQKTVLKNHLLGSEWILPLDEKAGEGSLPLARRRYCCPRNITGRSGDAHARHRFLA